MKSALAMGADKAIHVQTDLKTDQKLQPLHVAKVLQHFALKEKINLIILGKHATILPLHKGKQSIDDDFN